MKRVRFAEAQIIGALRGQEIGAKGADLCRTYGMSEAKRLKALEDEDAKLKRLLEDAMLDAAALAGKVAGPAEKREAVFQVRCANVIRVSDHGPGPILSSFELHRISPENRCALFAPML